MNGVKLRRCYLMLALATAIVVLAGIGATSCGGSGQSGEIEKAVKMYYKFVRENDASGQIAAWLPSAAKLAGQQARTWEQADRSNLKVVDIHTVEAETAGEMIVHVVLQTENPSRESVVLQEGWTLLMRKEGSQWLIKDALLQ